MDKNQEAIIQKTVDFVKATLSDTDASHDWWHIYRIWQLSKHIAQTENVDLFVVELGALLHDISDWKNNSGDSTVGAKIAADFLKKQNVNEKIILAVKHILENISFKGISDNSNMETIEGKIIQDADKLDAIGAIGIGRCFTYGGYKEFPMHDPEIIHNKEEFGKRFSKTSINHFHEKLLLLKDLMNTETGKSLAQHRHECMEQFLLEFHKEWDGEL
ncbi:MAG: HD domain-containing protein [Candidatus Moraniibacteriota bacterium]